MDEDKLWLVQTGYNGRDWTNHYDLVYDEPVDEVLNQVAGANPGLNVRWASYKQYSVTPAIKVP